jgi:hypothetical protein
MQVTYLNQNVSQIYDDNFGVINLNVISSTPVDFIVNIQILTSDGCIYNDIFTYNDFNISELNNPKIYSKDLI